MDLAPHPGRGEVNAPPVIRAMRAADAARVAELAGELGYPGGADDILRRFAVIERAPDADVFVAEDADGMLLGWVHVVVTLFLESGPFVEVGGLVVAHEARGRGIGRALMDRAEQWTRDRGCATIRLRSNVVRDAAHAFYAHLGYERFKTQHAFRKRVD